MPDRHYYARVQSLPDGKTLLSCTHRGPLAALLNGRLRRIAEESDKRSNPRYHVDIGGLHTEQRALFGCIHGPLAPVLAGETMDRARILDAGQRLSDDQRKGAYHGTRH
jgi:hypothetical protein